ncbi:MAG: PAS domain S-box protein [Bryobacterales bacterium]|nr:PAS domain S-box protein [Bryobacterales bacterium]
MRKRLRLAGARGRAFFDQSPLSILVFGADGYAIDANPAAERLWKSSRDKLREYNILRDARLESKGVLTHIRRAFEGEHTAAPPALLDRPDAGSEARPGWYEIQAYPVRDSRGTVCEVVVTFQDVSDRRQSEQERAGLLERAEQARDNAEDAGSRQAFLAEAGAVLVSSLDYQTTLASVARLAVPRIADWCAVDLLEEDGSLRRLAVAHADQAKSDVAWELSHRYPPGPDDVIPRVLRTGRPETAADISEDMLRRSARDPEHFRMIQDLGLCSYMVLPLVARGRILGAITFATAESGRRFGPIDLSVATDLAHRAAMAVDNARLYGNVMRERAAAQAALQALAESEERFRSLSTCSPVGKLMADVEGRCTYTNPRCQSICGFGEQEALGDGWTCFIHPADREAVVESWRQLVRTGGEFSRQFRFQRPDGSVRWVHMRSAPMLSSRGEPMGHAATFEDITESRLAEEELRRYNEDLQRFAYVASHDLKEPLRMVSTYTQMLAKRYSGRLDADADEFIGFVVDGVKRMRALIDDLLAYSRLINQRGETAGPADCEAVLDWVLLNLQVAIGESGAEIEREPLPVVPVDRVQIGQLLQNLIGNAIKYRGKEPPRIRIGARRNGAEWVFSVADNGIGIDPAYWERIFGVFKRLHGKEYPGTGIGLAICKKIVESHGGRIWVESQPGRGATFRFTLPALRETVADTAAKP